MEGIAADRAALNRMKDAYTAEASGCATFASIFLDEKSNLRIYVPQADIKKQFSGFPLNRSYTVRATVPGFGAFEQPVPRSVSLCSSSSFRGRASGSPA